MTLTATAVTAALDEAIFIIRERDGMTATQCTNAFEKARTVYEAALAEIRTASEDDLRVMTRSYHELLVLIETRLVDAHLAGRK